MCFRKKRAKQSDDQDEEEQRKGRDGKSGEERDRAEIGRLSNLCSFCAKEVYGKNRRPARRKNAIITGSASKGFRVHVCVREWTKIE